CYATEEQEAKATCISKVRATACRANTPRARKVNRDIFCLSCEPSPTRDWLGTRMLVNQRCCEKFRRRGRRSPPIRLPRFTQSSQLLNFQVIDAPRSQIFPV